ncbi:preprotein translocase subunit YajC [Nocardioides zeae]|uniref:Preprotein translocase subunit YajC n=1 Tax=Nocardioides imazamoxiresistens TaxID=3231893 RepID=A0ABU3PTK3_9ACTN|nr:preprotein translocase subunit YajC [Nocardioides zeae]MDT9592514.1 preprotein translocase subunit YajC [Nocardioides zeae]
MEIIFIVLLFVMMWLLLIRPAQRRQKAQTELQNSVQIGNDVMLTSGIFGTVTEMPEGDRLRIQIALGVEIEVVRGAIAMVVPKEDDGSHDALDADATTDSPSVDLDKH